MEQLPNTSPRTALLSIILTSTLAGVFPPMLTPAMAVERAANSETNLTGDIADSKILVKHQPLQDFFVLVPEGWSRTERKNHFFFADKFSRIDVGIGAATTSPSVASAKTQQVLELLNTGRAVAINSIKNIRPPSRAAVLIDQES
jgi:hypothetical protein